MNTHPITQKIKAAYLRAVNNEMVGDYQPSFVANLMRRIVELIFRTPDFAIELPIEPQWRDYYNTALCISAYLGYVQYTIVADDTLAVITLTDPYRSQILAAATAAAPTTTDVAAADTAAADTADTATDTAAPQFVGAQYFAPASTTPPAAPTEPSTPPTRAVRPRAPIAAANFRLKAVTTASLKGSLCNSRGQGRRGRPQPSDPVTYVKSLEDDTLPTRASPQSPANQINTLMPPISPISLSAHPPPRPLSAALS
ncbi:MAG: hypothetical protein ACI30K_01750 [Muribaculaceae bacterium]